MATPAVTPGIVPPAQGTKAAAINLAHSVIGGHPKTWAVIFIAMVILLLVFIILFIVMQNKYKECERGKHGFLGTNPLGNLSTGGNNPLPFMQMGDAGWGGSMHSTYQKGQPRVWGASAEGGHSMAVVPQARSCGSGCDSGGMMMSPAAVGEAQALMAAQSLEPAGSAKNMSDDALMRVMNGGSA